MTCMKLGCQHRTCSDLAAGDLVYLAPTKGTKRVFAGNKVWSKKATDQCESLNILVDTYETNLGHFIISVNFNDPISGVNLKLEVFDAKNFEEICTLFTDYRPSQELDALMSCEDDQNSPYSSPLQKVELEQIKIEADAQWKEIAGDFLFETSA